MTTQVAVDVDALHHEIQIKYAEVALTPGKGFHFHTGRTLAERLGYPTEVLDALSEKCVESFAGVGNPLLGWRNPTRRNGGGCWQRRRV